MRICLRTEVKQQWAYVSTWMGDPLSSRQAVGCVFVGIFLRHQTFVNSSELLMSLMALRSCLGFEIPFGLVIYGIYQTYFNPLDDKGFD